MQFNPRPASSSYPLKTLPEIEKYAEGLRNYFIKELGRDAVYYINGSIKIERIVERAFNGLFSLEGWTIKYVEELKASAGSSDRHFGQTLFNEKRVEIAGSSNGKTLHDYSIRTTVAHEFYHVLQHEDYALRNKIEEMPEDLEGNAKAFARIFLLPAKEFFCDFLALATKDKCRLIGSGGVENTEENIRWLTEEVIPELSKAYQVATFSVGIRIKELNLLGCRDMAEKVLQKLKNSPKKIT